MRNKRNLAVILGGIWLFSASILLVGCTSQQEEQKNLENLPAPTATIADLHKTITQLREDIANLQIHIARSNCGILRDFAILHSNIAPGNYEIIDEALEKFDPRMHRYLAIIPTIIGDARTAYARTSSYEPPQNVHTVVSRDWDNIFGESVYWYIYKARGARPDDPVFSRKFKLTLFVHEYLHHAERKANLDLTKFSEDVNAWYNDLSWGSPRPGGNYQKYSLFWSVYGGNGFPSDQPPGREEFAYIGEAIANGGKERLNEVPQNIIAYYRGILRENLLTPVE